METVEMNDLKEGDVVKLTEFNKFKKEKEELFGIVISYDKIKTERKNDLVGKKPLLKKLIWFTVLKSTTNQWNEGIEYTMTNNDLSCVWGEIERLNKEEVDRFMRDKMLEAD